MDNIKVEQFNGYNIRFVYLVDKEEWYTVGKDIARALGYADLDQAVRMHVEKQDKERLKYKASVKTTEALWAGNDYSNKTVISEFGIYDLVFNSQLETAKEFKRWVYHVIKELRHKAELHQYEVFRLVEDRDIQKGLMVQLDDGLNGLTPRQAIKANTIANKATSNVFGFSKMVKKDEMTDEMKLKRQDVLKDVVELMTTQKKFGLDDLSISKTVYTKYQKASA